MATKSDSDKDLRQPVQRRNSDSDKYRRDLTRSTVQGKPAFDEVSQQNLPVSPDGND